MDSFNVKSIINEIPFFLSIWLDSGNYITRNSETHEQLLKFQDKLIVLVISTNNDHQYRKNHLLLVSLGPTRGPKAPSSAAAIHRS